jgi:hypothetical protein
MGDVMASTWTKLGIGRGQTAALGDKAPPPVVRKHRCRRCGTEITTELAYIRHCHICGTTLPVPAKRCRSLP